MKHTKAHKRIAASVLGAVMAVSSTLGMADGMFQAIGADLSVATSAQETAQTPAQAAVSLDAAKATDTFGNHGYPYGKSATKIGITLVAELAGDITADSVQWQYSSERDGTYVNVRNATSLEYTFSNPKDGYWYRCMVDGTASEAVQLMTSGGTAMKKLGKMCRESFNGYWYVSNGTVAYTSLRKTIWRHEGDKFDIMGLYKKDDISYWLNTSYSEGWQMYDNRNAVRIASAAESGYTNYGQTVHLDALRFWFDEGDSGNAHRVCMQADLGAGYKAFCFGADTAIGNNAATSKYNLGVVNAVEEEDGTLQKIQLIGADTLDDASLEDPSIIVQMDSAPDAYWLGQYSGRQKFGFNESSPTAKLLDVYNVGYISEVRKTDSGMTVSYNPVESGGAVDFSFYVGTALDTGVTLGQRVVVTTNGQSTDASGGEAVVSEKNGVTTITAKPNKTGYSTFAGWYANGEQITDDNKESYGIASLTGTNGEVLTFMSGVSTYNIEARFVQNFKVTYNTNGKSIGMPAGLTDGIDDNNGAGYALNDSYTTLTPEEQILTDEQKYFVGWNTKADGTGKTVEAGEALKIESDTTLYAQWADYPTLSFDANNGSGVVDSIHAEPYATVTLPDGTGFSRTDYMFVGWSDEPTDSGTPQYVAGDTLVLARDTTLYAVWLQKGPGVIHMQEAVDTEVTSTKLRFTYSGDKPYGFILQASTSPNFDENVKSSDQVLDDTIDNFDELTLDIADLWSGTVYYARAVAYFEVNGKKIYSGNTPNLSEAAFSNAISFTTNVRVGVSGPRKVQVCLAVGDTQANYYNFNDSLTKALEAQGIDEVKILSNENAETQSQTTFDWMKWDHTIKGGTAILGDEGQHILPIHTSESSNVNNNLERHVVESVNANGDMEFNFRNYGTSGFRDFYLYPNNQSTRKEIEFTVTDGLVDVGNYDALDGAGFFVNASVTGEYSQSSSNQQVLNGYMVMINYSGTNATRLSVWKFDNCSTFAMQDVSLSGAFNGSGPVSFGSGRATLVATASGVTASNYFRKMHIKVLPTELKVWYVDSGSGSKDKNNATATAALHTDLTTLAKNNSTQHLVSWSNGYGTTIPLTAAYDGEDTVHPSFRGGFGPIASYNSHGCSANTNFIMRDVKMDMDVVPSLTEIIRQPQWDNGYDLYLINLNEAPIDDFSDVYNTSEIIARLTQDNIKYIGWCNGDARLGNMSESNAFLTKVNPGDGKKPNGVLVERTAAAKNGLDENTQDIQEIARFIAANTPIVSGEETLTVAPKYNAVNMSTADTPEFDKDATHETGSAALNRFIFDVEDTEWEIGGRYFTLTDDGGWVITRSKTAFDQLKDGKVEIAEDRETLTTNGNLSADIIRSFGTGYYQVYRATDFNDPDKAPEDMPVYLQIRINQKPVAGFSADTVKDATDGNRIMVYDAAQDDNNKYEVKYEVSYQQTDSDGKTTDVSVDVTDLENKDAYFEDVAEEGTVYMIKQTVTDTDGEIAIYTATYQAGEKDSCNVPFNGFKLSKNTFMTGRDEGNMDLNVTDTSNAVDGSNVRSYYTIQRAEGNKTYFYKLNEATGLLEKGGYSTTSRNTTTYYNMADEAMYKVVMDSKGNITGYLSVTESGDSQLDGSVAIAVFKKEISAFDLQSKGDEMKRVQALDMAGLDPGTYTVGMTAFATSVPVGVKTASDFTAEVKAAINVQKGYSIKYDLDGGNIGGKTSIDTQWVLNESEITVNETAPVKDGYKFLYYTVNKDATKKVEPKDTYTVDESDVLLTAVYEPTLTLTVENAFQYYSGELADGVDPIHDPQLAANYPKTVRLQLQWRKQGSSDAFANYDGQVEAYHDPFTVTSDMLNAEVCANCTDGVAKPITSNGSVKLAGLEISNADNTATYEYQLAVVSEIANYKTELAGTGDELVAKPTSDDSEKTLKVATKFEPASKSVSVNLELFEKPNWYIQEVAETKMTAVIEYLDPNTNKWVEVNQADGAERVELTKDNLTASTNLWEGLTYRLKFESFVLNGKERVGEDGTLTLPNILTISYSDPITLTNDSTNDVLTAELALNSSLVEIKDTVTAEKDGVEQTFNDVLTPKKDIVLDEPLQIDGNAVIDLRGYTITGAPGHNTIELIGADSTVIILDTAETPGKIVGGAGKDNDEGEGGKGGSGIYAPDVTDEDKIDVDPDVKVTGGKGGLGGDGTRGDDGEDIESIHTQTEKAKEDIENKVEEAKKDIMSNEDLTDEEKDKIVGDLDKAKDDALNTLNGEDPDNPDTPNTLDDIQNILDGIDTVTEEKDQEIDNTTKDKIDQAKEDAKKAVDDKRQELEDELGKDLENLPNLTDEEKEQAKKDIEEAVNKAKEHIDSSEDSDQATQQGEAEKQLLDDLKQNLKDKDQENLDNAKEEAKKEIDNKAEETKQQIDEDPNLTDEEKEQAKKDVDDAAEKAKGDIDTSTTVDDVNTKKGEGDTAIDNEKNEADDLSDKHVADAKEEAKTEIDNKAEETKKQIDEDPNLTDEEKEQAKKDVDDAADKAKEDIDNAGTVDDVNTKKDEGDTAIDNEKKEADDNSKKNVDDAKEEAKKEIDEKAEETKKQIDEDPNLTDEEKEQAKKDVDDAAEKAKEDIDNSTTIDDVNTKKDEGDKSIDDEKQGADDTSKKHVDDAKEEAKKEIDDKAEEIKKQIDDDPNLTDEEKEQAKKDVDDAADKAKEDIDNAGTVDDVNTKKDEGDTAIDNEKKEADDTSKKNVDDAKEEAKKEIDDKAEETKKQIDEDPNLTDEEKEQAKKDVDDAAEKAKEDIDNSTTVDDVNTKKDEGDTAIDNEKQEADDTSKKHVDDAKEEAKNELIEKAEEAKKEIDELPNLTDEEKEEAKKEIDDLLQKALEELEKAEDTGSIDDKIKDTTEGIKGSMDDLKSESTTTSTETTVVTETTTTETTASITDSTDTETEDTTTTTETTTTETTTTVTTASSAGPTNTETEDTTTTTETTATETTASSAGPTNTETEGTTATTETTTTVTTASSAGPTNTETEDTTTTTETTTTETTASSAGPTNTETEDTTTTTETTTTETTVAKTTASTAGSTKTETDKTTATTASTSKSDKTTTSITTATTAATTSTSEAETTSATETSKVITTESSEVTTSSTSAVESTTTSETESTVETTETTETTQTTLQTIEVKSDVTVEATVPVGEKVQLVVPEGFEGEMTWSSSDSEAVTVDEEGIITVIGTVETIITGTDANGNTYNVIVNGVMEAVATLGDVGYYFSADTRAFVPSDLLTVQYGGEDVTDQVTFDLASPKEVFEAQEAAYVAVELTAYYNGVELDVKPLVYIGVKGDVNLNGTVDMMDAYNALLYNSYLSAGSKTYTFTDGEDENLEKLVYFLADVDTESKRGMNEKPNVEISMMDAYHILLFNSYKSAGGEKRWDELITSLTDLEGSMWYVEQ